MPLPSTDATYKTNLLQQNGYDPGKYDLDDDGNVTEKVFAQPASLDFSSSPIPSVDSNIVSKPVKPASDSSVFGAFGRSAASSTLPTLGGLGAAGVTASILGAPGTGGLSLLGLLGVLGAGVGGSYAANKLQNSLLPDSAKQQLAEDAQQHPVASELGGLAPSALAFNPVTGAKNLLGIGTEGSGALMSGMRAFSKGTASLTQPELQRLTSTLANIGIQGGQDIASQSISDQPFNWKELGFQTAAGALFNEPTALGKKFFPQGHDVQPNSEVNNVTEPVPQIPIAKSPDYATPNPISGNPPLDTSGLMRSAENSPIVSRPKTDAMYNWTGDLGVGDAPNIMESEGGTAGLTKEEPNQRLVDFLKAKEEENKQNSNAEFQQNAEGVKSALENSQLGVGNSTPENAYIKNAAGEETSIPTKDYTVVTEQGNKEVEAESAEDLSNRKLEGNTGDKYQPTKQNNPDLLKKQGDEYFKKVAKIARDRGISLVEADKVYNQEGIEQRGKYSPSTREATISSTKATADTPVHEITHGFMDDLKNSNIPSDQKLWKNAIDLNGGSEKAADEAITQKVGEAKAGQLKGDKSPMGEWFKDFVARWKNNLGVANEGDVIRHLSQRLETDAPRGTRGEVGGDFQAYAAAQGRMKDLINRGDTSNPEFMKAWQDSENIKNKNGGMPPSESKYQPLGGDIPISKEQEKEHELEHKTAIGFRPEADKILIKEGPRAQPFIDAAGKQIDEAKENYARYRTSYDDATKGLTDEEKQHIEDVGHKENADKAFQNDELTPKEKAAYNKIKETLKGITNERNIANQPVKDFDSKGNPIFRKAGVDPYYWPNQADPNKIEMLRDGLKGGNELKQKWMDFEKKNGATDEEAKARIDAVVNAYGGKPGLSNLAHFHGLDVAQGHGLPYEMMRPGMDRNLDRYFRRVANARSYHDNIESNPKVAPLLGITSDPWGKSFNSKEAPLSSPEARDVFTRMKGEDYHADEAKIKPYINVANALALGVPTNMHIAVSSVANAQAYLHPDELVSANVHALGRFSQSIQDAVSTGSIQPKRQMFHDILDAHSTQQERLRSLADGISRLNGRGVTDYVTKSITQGIGDYLVRARIPMAKKGDVDAIRLMRSFDPEWSATKQYGENDIKKAASAFTGMLHGNHDFRTLPSWMLKDTILQPFMSLASWNIAQTNQFMKHVWTPATRGNYTPLIMSTLGAGIGGYILKQGREALSAKKSPIPSLGELVNSPGGLDNHIPLAAYNLMAMGSYSGFAGILSTGARSLFDIAYKNPRQSAMFPLDEIVSSSGKTMMDSISALMNSSPSEYGKIASKATADLFRENVQSARIAISWADEMGYTGEERHQKKTLNMEEGDLRRWKMINNLPYEDQGSIDESNPYFNLSRKSFQHDTDVQEASQQLPDLIQQAMQQSGGNIEVLRNRLKALKDSSYPSMPSMENTPIQFWHYVKFLNDTQGPQVASQRVAEYMKMNAINKMKASMVPSY